MTLLIGSNRLYTPPGRHITVNQIYQKPISEQRLYIRTYNERVVVGILCSITAIEKMPTVKITLKKWPVTMCAETELLVDSQWVKAKDIQPGQMLYANGLLAHQDKEWLRRQLVDKMRPVMDVANECMVTSSTIAKAAKKYNIPTLGERFGKPVSFEGKDIIAEPIICQNIENGHSRTMAYEVRVLSAPALVATKLLVRAG